jgi:uncharacterized protein YegL
MELNIKVMDGHTVRMHPGDIHSLQSKRGSFVRLSDSATGMTAVGVIEMSPEMQVGEVGLDSTIIETLGSEEGMSIEVAPYLGQPILVKNVIFGIRPMTGIEEEESLVRAREWGPSLLRFVDEMVVAAGQRFRWSEGGKVNMVLSIIETEPPIPAEKIGVLRKADIQEYRFKLITDEPPFNGVLIIDLSKSMNEKDMEVRNIRNAINYISSEMRDPLTQEFLSHFRDGERVERWRGAVLSALMYLVAKIARGKGEKISVILFSDQAHYLVFNNQMAFDATSGGSVAPFAQALINGVNQYPRNATFMGRAMQVALDVIKASQDPKKMKMVVLLTDGLPNDRDELRELIKTSVAPRYDIVLFVAGIGQDLSDDLMREITTSCGGEYLNVEDLDALVKWYSELARKLTVKGRKA